MFRIKFYSCTLSSSLIFLLSKSASCWYLRLMLWFITHVIILYAIKRFDRCNFNCRLNISEDEPTKPIKYRMPTLGI